MTDFSKALAAMLALVPDGVERGLDRVASEIRDEAKRSTRFKDGPGAALRNSIGFVASGELARTVMADKDYAPYVEFGNNQSGEYIYPKNGKALAFQGSGGTVFAKRVRAHGPLPFMMDAVERVSPRASGLVSEELASALS